MKGHKHLIKCRCILNQFKNRKDPPAHHFVVFSELNDNDEVKEKFAQCNNCGILHRVFDICRSEIIDKKEDSHAILSIDDIKLTLPQNLSAILDKNYADIATWEQSKFIIENKLWDSKVIITSESSDESRNGKVLTILGDTLYKIDSFSRKEVITDE